MNRQEAERLKPGARVLYLAGEPTACTGAVLGVAPEGVEIEWDDGKTSIVLYPEMLDVERYDGPPILPTVGI